MGDLRHKTRPNLTETPAERVKHLQKCEFARVWGGAAKAPLPSGPYLYFLDYSFVERWKSDSTSTINCVVHKILRYSDILWEVGERN